jgi:hypothetical protein
VFRDNEACAVHIQQQKWLFEHTQRFPSTHEDFRACKKSCEYTGSPSTRKDFRAHTKSSEHARRVANTHDFRACTKSCEYIRFPSFLILDNNITKFSPLPHLSLQPYMYRTCAQLCLKNCLHERINLFDYLNKYFKCSSLLQ